MIEPKDKNAQKNDKDDLKDTKSFKYYYTPIIEMAQIYV